MPLSSVHEIPWPNHVQTGYNSFVLDGSLKSPKLGNASANSPENTTTPKISPLNLDPLNPEEPENTPHPRSPQTQHHPGSHFVQGAFPQSNEPLRHSTDGSKSMSKPVPTVASRSSHPMPHKGREGRGFKDHSYGRHCRYSRESSNNSMNDFLHIPPPSHTMIFSPKRPYENQIPNDLTDRLQQAEREQHHADGPQPLGDSKAQSDNTNTEKNRAKAFNTENAAVPRKLAEKQRTAPGAGIGDNQGFSVDSTRDVAVHDNNRPTSADEHLSVPEDFKKAYIARHSPKDLHHHHHQPRPRPTAQETHPEIRSPKYPSHTHSDSPHPDTAFKSDATSQHPPSSANISRTYRTAPQSLGSASIRSPYATSARYSDPLPSNFKARPSPAPPSKDNASTKSKYSGRTITGRYFHQRLFHRVKRL